MGWFRRWRFILWALFHLTRPTLKLKRIWLVDSWDTKGWLTALREHYPLEYRTLLNKANRAGIRLERTPGNGDEAQTQGLVANKKA
jgi:hypothetical protein